MSFSVNFNSTMSKVLSHIDSQASFKFAQKVQHAASAEHFTCDELNRFQVGKDGDQTDPYWAVRQAGQSQADEREAQQAGALAEQDAAPVK